MNRAPIADSHRSPTAQHTEPGDARFTALMFSAAAGAFILGGLITIWAGPPPSEAPVLGMLSLVLWALAAALLAIGSVAVVRSPEALRRRRSGTLALGALGLGAVVGLQWVTWAYVDLRASLHEDYDLALATVITPFGAGHILFDVATLLIPVCFLWAATAGTHLSRRF